MSATRLPSAPQRRLAGADFPIDIQERSGSDPDETMASVAGNFRCSAEADAAAFLKQSNPERQLPTFKFRGRCAALSRSAPGA